MKFVDSIGAAFGFGAVSLTIETENGVQYRGEPVRCLVRVFGGRVPQTIISITVNLRNYRINGQSVNYTTLDTQTFVDVEKIMPGEMREISCVLRLPDEASLTVKHQAGVRIDAEAKILYGVMRRRALSLDVEPHRECFLLTSAMSALGFPLRSRFVEVPNQGRTVRAGFSIRPELQDQADSVELYAVVSGQWLRGRMVLHTHRASVGDYLKAAVGLQKQSVAFEIPRNALRTPDEFANLKHGMNALRETLAQALILPEHAAGWMLRASQAPEIGKDELLRPAAGNPSTDSAELLRPDETRETECPA